MGAARWTRSGWLAASMALVFSVATLVLIMTATLGGLPGGQRQKLSIAIMTMAISPRPNVPGAAVHAPPIKFGWTSMVNKDRYCTLHGYSFIPVMWSAYSDLAPSWVKIPALQRHLPDYDWVWALDLDAWITNFTITIEDHILAKMQNKAADLILSKDCNGINCGSMFIRRSDWTMDLLNRVWQSRHKTEAEVPGITVWWEQAVFMQVLNQTDPVEAAQHIEYLSPQAMNAYPKPGCGAHWAPGDFVLHLAGMPATKKMDVVGSLAPHAVLSDDHIMPARL